MASSSNKTTTADATPEAPAPEVTAPVFQGFDSPDATSTEPVRPEGGKGQTLVRTPVGYAHDPGFDDLPLVTEAGLLVTADQAARIIKESAEVSSVGNVYKEGE